MTTALAMGMGMVSAHAEVVNIPWSAALPTNADPDHQCVPSFPDSFGSDSDECYLAFPLSIPVGHTIQQIAVYHGTDNMFPGGQPYFYAHLETVTTAPTATESSKFSWESSNAVPTDTIQTHRLMMQVNNIYFDQFQVAPKTTYQVVVALMNGASVSGIEVTYN